MKGSANVVLAGDIGGTNSRLGFFSSGPDRPVPVVEKTFNSRQHKDLSEIIERFISSVDIDSADACFGVAGPVKDGYCRTTNLPWEISEQSLKKKFGWRRVALLNDLHALAHAVTILEPHELAGLNTGDPIIDGPIGIIAPGTGLGMSLLVREAGQEIVLPSEGGHSDFAPNGRAERRLWDDLNEKLGHVSVERLLSGKGLVGIYDWIIEKGLEKKPDWLRRDMETGDPARVVSKNALTAKDAGCIKALDMFVSILGSTAGNLALIGLTTGGVYLGGGIAPKILPILQSGGFMKAFLNKGRFEGLMRQIPVNVILYEKAALLGAARRGLQHYPLLDIGD